MKIILLKDIKGVGRKFDEKDVSAGYANNFLLPKKLAVPASGANASQLKTLKENEAKRREAEAGKLSESLSKISALELSINLKANEKGSLFASLTKEKISELLAKQGIVLDPEYIALKQPIKQTGTFEVLVRAGDKESRLKLEVKAA